MHSTSHEDGKCIETKVVILGSSGVGKTSIVNQLLYNKYTTCVPATIGASFNIKTLSVSESDKISLYIWDTAGQERFHSMAPMYYRNAHAAVLVFDVNNNESFQKVSEWVKELKNHVGSRIVLVIAANKIDLLSENPSTSSSSPLIQQAEQYSHTIGAKVFQTSAKTGLNINQMFQHIANELYNIFQLENASFVSTNNNNNIKLHDQPSHTQTNSSCC